MYWPKGWLNARTALGHKLMPSAQRWADHRGYGGTSPPPPDHRFPRPIKGGNYWCNQVVVVFMPSEMVVFWGSIVYRTIYILEIKTGLVVFSFFFYIFVLYSESVGYIASYKEIFQYWQNWKLLFQGVPLKRWVIIICWINIVGQSACATWSTSTGIGSAAI